MYPSYSNPYISGGGGNPQLQFQQGRESAYLSKVGENIMFNQDYAQTLNKVAKNKQEYGEMLRLQMKEKQDQKAIQNEERGLFGQNRSNVYNPNQFSQLEQNRNQQMKSDIFNQGGNFAGGYQNMQSQQQQQYPQQSLMNPYYQQPQQNMYDYQTKREEYIKRSEIYWSQPKNYRGSLLKEYYNDTYFEDKERKQKAFAQSLADQINEKRLQQRQLEKPKNIDYLPEGEAIEKNKSSILDSIMKIQNKSNENDPLSSYKVKLEPTNSINKNHILYNELNKSDNAYRWQPGGEWSRGKADFDVLKGFYRNQVETFEKQKEDLRFQADNAQRTRDKQYVDMVIMRDKIAHNDRARALNVNNQELDSTAPRGQEGQAAEPHNYFQNKQGVTHGLYVHKERYDNIYFKHNHELPSQSTMLNPNYIQNKFDKMQHPIGKQNQGFAQDNILGQLEGEDPNLEQMLDNFYKEEAGGEQQIDNSFKRKRIKSAEARVNLNKMKQKPNPNQLNQSQFTEYNLLHQLEEEESNQQKKTKPGNNQQQQQQSVEKDQNNMKKSQHQNQQDNEFNEGNISQFDGVNNKPEDVDNLDISKIESQKNLDENPQKSHKSIKQDDLKDPQKLEENQVLNQGEEEGYEEQQDHLQKRPYSAFNKRNEINKKELLNQSEVFPYRLIKEKSIYDNLNKQSENLQIDFKKLYSMQERENNIHDGEAVAAKQILDKSTDQDQDINRILDEIGGMMQDIHINQEVTIPHENFVKQMQFDKHTQINKLHTVNNYNNGIDNPYINDVYKKEQQQPNKISLENTPENKLFLQSSNHIDYLIGQLVQDRKIY